MRAVTFDCTMFSSGAARFMLPILATASTILKSSACICVLSPRSRIETNLFSYQPVFLAMGPPSIRKSRPLPAFLRNRFQRSSR